MAPGTLDLYIYCGTTIDAGSHTLTYKVNGVAVDLTGASARAKAVASLDGNTMFDISSAESTIILGGVAGTIIPLITAPQTSAMWKSSYVTKPGIDGRPWAKAGKWDLEITESGGAVRRLLMGDVYLSPEVTAP